MRRHASTCADCPTIRAAAGEHANTRPRRMTTCWPATTADAAEQATRRDALRARAGVCSEMGEACTVSAYPAAPPDTDMTTNPDTAAATGCAATRSCRDSVADAPDTSTDAGAACRRTCLSNTVAEPATDAAAGCAATRSCRDSVADAPDTSTDAGAACRRTCLSNTVAEPATDAAAGCAVSTRATRKPVVRARTCAAAAVQVSGTPQPNCCVATQQGARRPAGNQSTHRPRGGLPPQTGSRPAQPSCRVPGPQH